MKRLSGSIVALGLFLGASVQAGSGFDSVPFPMTRKILFDLAKKCQVNPATTPQEWVNTVTGPDNFQKFSRATQALSNKDDKSYQDAIQQMGCPINNKGTWSIK